MGGILYNVVVLLAVLALLTKFRRRRILFGLCLVQYGLIPVQLRLGLGSNENAGLLTYHNPVGVLVFFFSCLTAAMAFGLRVESGQA